MIRSKLVLGIVVALGVAGLGAAAVAMENDSGGTDSIASEPTTTVVIDPSTTVSTTDAPGTGTEPVMPADDVADDVADDAVDDEAV